MTKTRTLRESSKRLSERHKFKRKLDTQPYIMNALAQRDERINRVSPVKDILIYEPMNAEPLTPIDPNAACETFTIDMPPRVRITRDNTNWPFRVEYIEQLLDIHTLWVVVADGRSPNSSYSSSSGSATSHDHAASIGISLDLIKIEKPQVVLGEVQPLGNGRRTLWREKQLRELEETGKPKTMVYGGAESIWVRGKRPDQVTDIYLCNILPKNLTMYNCSFYNRDVAHLYMESLSEHIKRFTQRQDSTDF